MNKDCKIVLCAQNCIPTGCVQSACTGTVVRLEVDGWSICQMLVHSVLKIGREGRKTVMWDALTAALTQFFP